MNLDNRFQVFQKVKVKNNKGETIEQWEGVGIVPAISEEKAIEIYKRYTIGRTYKKEYMAKKLKVTKK